MEEGGSRLVRRDEVGVLEGSVVVCDIERERANKTSRAQAMTPSVGERPQQCHGCQLHWQRAA